MAAAAYFKHCYNTEPQQCHALWTVRLTNHTCPADCQSHIRQSLILTLPRQREFFINQSKTEQVKCQDVPWLYKVTHTIKDDTPSQQDENLPNASNTLTQIHVPYSTAGRTSVK